jgi:lysophospholipase L1-like esterase
MPVELTSSQPIASQDLSRPRTIVCLGDSLTRGLVSASFVDQLEQRLAGKGLHFVNSGVNGDLAYNVLRRLDDVIALQPNAVILMIGTNDILSTLRRSNAFISRVTKWLPKAPSLGWYQANILEIVRRLKTETGAIIALSSPPIVGEHLDTRSNRQARPYVAFLKETAASLGLAYLPVYERMADYLKSTGQHEGTSHHSRVFMTARLTVRHIFFKESYDSISLRNGFILLTDGVHLNEKGASLVADVMEEFLSPFL